MKQTQQEQQNGAEARGVATARNGNKGGAKNNTPSSPDATLDMTLKTLSNPAWDSGASKRKDNSVSGAGTAAEMKKAGL